MSWKITKIVRSSTSLSLKASCRPTMDAGRVGDLGQVQALRRRTQVVLLEGADERAKHRVRRSEVSRDVDGILPLGSREGLLPEEQPHLGQVYAGSCRRTAIVHPPSGGA